MRHLLLGWVVVCSPLCLDAATLYGTSFSGLQLITINTATGAGTVVGNHGISAAADLASFGNALYLYDQNNPDRIVNLNPADGSTISSVTSGFDVFGEGSTSFRSDGILFGTNSAGAIGTLFSCSNVTVNNTCSAVGPLEHSMDAIAFNSAGVLYGLTQSPTGTSFMELYTINTASAALTFIGSSNIVGANLGGLAFDPDTGILYAASGSSLYTVNQGTGAMSLVGDTGFTSLSGIAFLSAVPEPSSALLALAGLGLVALIRKG